MTVQCIFKWRHSLHTVYRALCERRKDSNDDEKTGEAGHDRGEEHEGSVAANLEVRSRSGADAFMRVPSSPGGLDWSDEIVVDSTADVHVYCTLCGPSVECSCRI